MGRDASGKFVKGFSGNPNGSKVIVPEAVRAAALELSVKAIRTLEKWMNSDDPQASIMSAKIILDRGLGKAIQPLVGAGGQSLVSITMNSGAIITADDAATAYREICGNPALDISALSFAAPTASQRVECPKVESLPSRPTESDERRKLWSRLGEEK